MTRGLIINKVDEVIDRVVFKVIKKSFSIEDCSDKIEILTIITFETFFEINLITIFFYVALYILR